MQKYTTGEIAKLCGVSVRTIQYYDQRNILVPSQLSEGGRRLYTQDDVEKMKMILFLRDIGISIEHIKQLLEEEHRNEIINLLLNQRKEELQSEIKAAKEKLEKIENIAKELKNFDEFSVASFRNIDYVIRNKKKMHKLYFIMIVVGIPFSLFQWIGIYAGFATGNWWILLIWLLLDIPLGIWISKYMHQNLVYVCPKCHTIFKPPYKEMLFADHTVTLRKLTCTSCGYHGFCIETYREEN